MNLDLNGHTALITASSGGIGLEIARSLAAEGARVIINGRTQDSVEKALAGLRKDFPSAELVGLATDNGNAAGCDKTVSMRPEVDILVNNLGIYEAVGFFDETDEAWQKMFQVNIMSGVRLARHYLRGMLERGHGRIVFISSESGISPAPEMAHYSATKTMQLGIARSLAELTKGTKVTVNSVSSRPHAHRRGREIHPGSISWPPSGRGRTSIHIGKPSDVTDCSPHRSTRNRRHRRIRLQCARGGHQWVLHPCRRRAPAYSILSATARRLRFLITLP